MTRTRLPFGTVKSDDFIAAKKNEFLRALHFQDTQAAYFLKKENSFLKNIPVIPEINYVVQDSKTERFNARFRDLCRAINANDHLSAELCLREYSDRGLREYSDHEKGEDLNLNETRTSNGLSLSHLICLAPQADLKMAEIIMHQNQKTLSDAFENTPLHLAAMFNRNDLAQFFLDLGHNPNLLNCFRLRPIDFAFFNQNHQLAQSFLIWNESFVPKTFLEFKEESVSEITPEINLSVDSQTTELEDIILEIGAEFSSQEIDSSRIEEISKQTTDFLKTNGEYFEKWQEEQREIAQKKEAQKEELKTRNRETNLMFAEDKLSKAAEEVLAKELKDEKNRAAQKNRAQEFKEKALKEMVQKASVKKEEEAFLEKIFAESLELKKQKISNLNDFFDKAYKEAGFERKFKIAIEDPDLEKNCERILGNLLLIAVLKNNVSLVKKILNNPVAAEFLDINFKDRDQNTPLIKACQIGALEIAKLLIEAGADVKTFDNKNNGVLHYCAAIKDDAEIFKSQKTKPSEISAMIILKVGEDFEFLSKKNLNNFSAIEVCCKAQGNGLVLQNILKSQGYQEKSGPELTNYLVNLAVSYTKHPQSLTKEVNWEVIKFLKSNGAIINAENKAQLAECLRSQSSAIQPSASTATASSFPIGNSASKSNGI